MHFLSLRLQIESQTNALHAETHKKNAQAIRKLKAETKAQAAVIARLHAKEHEHHELEQRLNDSLASQSAHDSRALAESDANAAEERISKLEAENWALREMLQQNTTELSPAHRFVMLSVLKGLPSVFDAPNSPKKLAQDGTATPSEAEVLNEVPVHPVIEEGTPQDTVEVL